MAEAAKTKGARAGLCAFLWLMLATAATMAAAVPQPAPLAITEDFGSAPADPALALYEDRGATMDFEHVLAGADFIPAAQLGSNFGFSRSAWWARLTLRNDSGRDREVMLRQDYPLIDWLELWTQDRDGRWQVLRTGDMRPFGSRPIAHRDFIFPLRLAAGQTRTVYLRYQSSGAMNIGLSLYSPHRLLEEVSLEQLAYGMYFGGFAVLFFYNLFIFATVRDRAFLYYLLYVGSYGLYFGVHDGLSFQFLWPDSPRWGNRALLVLLALTLLFGLQFTRAFLRSRQHSPRLDRAARVLQGLTLLCLAGSAFLSYQQLIQPLALLSIAVPLLIFALGSVGLAQGYRPARYFMLAWVVLLLGVLMYMAKTFGWLPHNALTQNGFQAGALLEMVLLSLALAARMAELQRQTLTDDLTGLSNRRYFDRQLELSFAHARDTGVSLLVLDIDHFKRVNDQLGHVRGDEVLCEVGQLLTRRAPTGATVCRYGGEEFTILLNGTLVQAEAAAQQLRAAVQAHYADGLGITVSIGVAHASGTRFGHESEFFKAADDALYRAKQAGRNRVEVAA